MPTYLLSIVLTNEIAMQIAFPHFEAAPPAPIQIPYTPIVVNQYGEQSQNVLYRSIRYSIHVAAEFLFAEASVGTTFRFHNRFYPQKGQCFDWIYQKENGGWQLYVVNYPTDIACPMEYEFCVSTLVEQFANEMEAQSLNQLRASGMAAIYLTAAHLFINPFITSQDDIITE